MLEFVQIQKLFKFKIYSKKEFVQKFKFCSNPKFVQNSNFVQSRNLFIFEFCLNSKFVQHSNFVQICVPNSKFSKFKICPNFKFVQHSEFFQKLNVFKIRNLLDFKKEKRKKRKNLGGIPYFVAHEKRFPSHGNCFHQLEKKVIKNNAFIV
jgi:hypothetical protein